ncbi:MAG: hypothetical protein WB792_07255 [Desulfobacterales bacterium]
MTAKRPIGLVVVIILTGLFSFPCFADEILFQNQKGVQTGVVVGEDDQSVTIRFPKATIKSVRRSGGEPSTPLAGKVIWEEGKDYLILKIPRRNIRVITSKTPALAPSMKQESEIPDWSQKGGKAVRSEGSPERIGKTGIEHLSGFPASMDAHQELLKEEMGSVEGVIMWQEKPLKNRQVKIVLERYTGFSPAALEKWFATDKEKSPQDGIVLETQTDSKGHYVFHEAPPGYYRLYWMPDKDTGWVRRLREKPDIEVTTGNLTVENVPEKKK